ncbi:hypothetical protein [Aureliella helgolandensis]|uniref:Uncharacterized protein n=1 Tax=Aureliella helgolandensis TaxID=2527968 RepID=A0A518GC42_9BACT|nr:hypothetical protein [Aureliella helgolandensis]QDV26169.1 hypothetical protein Q31a_45410 [Aureliella helgolandensis]|tara:strand:- start:222 stop:590 length:369 start_codon:yes stop_codon:yes gene_type:complete
MRFKTKMVSAVIVAAIVGSAGMAHAQHGGGSALFANQYTQGYANQATAQMYVAPVPVPAWAGHTYITYEPLAPHEFLYRHTDRYHNYYDGGRGLNRTKAHYYSPPVRTAAKGIWKSISLPRP